MIPDPGERLADRPPRPVDAAALGVLVGVRDLVGRDSERGDAALGRHVVGEPQHVRGTVVVVAQEPGHPLEPDPCEPVVVEQFPGELRAGQAGAVADGAVAREDGPHAALYRQPRDDRDEQQPEQPGHRTRSLIGSRPR